MAARAMVVAGFDRIQWMHVMTEARIAMASTDRNNCLGKPSQTPAPPACCHRRLLNIITNRPSPRAPAAAALPPAGACPLMDGGRFTTLPIINPHTFCKHL